MVRYDCDVRHQGEFCSNLTLRPICSFTYSSSCPISEARSGGPTWHSHCSQCVQTPLNTEFRSDLLCAVVLSQLPC